MIKTTAARQDTGMIPLLVASLIACLVNIALAGASPVIAAAVQFSVQ